MLVRVKLSEGAVFPKHANEGDAGLDLVAISRTETDNYIEYGTGVFIEIPENYVGLLFPRSSISNSDMSLANCVGVIDSIYRGEIKFRFKQATTFRRLFSLVKEFIRSGKIQYNDFSLGDKIGQLIIFSYPKIVLEKVSELSETARGEAGFGSSGQKH